MSVRKLALNLSRPSPSNFAYLGRRQVVGLDQARSRICCRRSKLFQAILKHVPA